MRPIPYGRQHITEEDIQAVVEVLRSDYLTQGPKIAEFEAAFADYIGCRYAVAVANGTAALHLAAMALGVKPGDKVITTPITFVASANCIRYCGGEVVFADIDPETWLLDIREVRKLLESSPPGTYKGIIPVDFTGRPIDMEAFRALADEFGLWLLEDACHAPGGYFTDSKGIRQYCGNGNYADLAIFSFHPVKHIATGEGGMVTTNDPKLYDKLMLLRTHGITRDPSRFVNPVSVAGGQEGYPNWYMEMQELGYNYRLTDFQAALGLSQLTRAVEGLARRRSIAARYAQAFSGMPALLAQSGVVEGHAYHLYILEVPKRLELFNWLRSKDILAQVHYIPTHLMPNYQAAGWREGNFPHAETYYRRCLSLPMFPSLSEEEQEFVIGTIQTFHAG